MKDTESYVNKAEVKRKIRVWLDYRTSRQVTDGLLDLIEKLPVMVKGQLETTLESEWISVRERMPEEGVDVLVYGDLCYGDNKSKGIEVDYVKHGTFVAFDEDVTHWMPLPVPPKGE